MRLSRNDVAEIAAETLEEWLPGYTAYDPKSDSQWRISCLGGGRYRFQQRGNPDQLFRVEVSVVEER